MAIASLEQEIEREAARLSVQLSSLQRMPSELLDLAATTYEINRLKKEKGAVILAHHYMRPEIKFGVADFVGDSLELSMKAQSLDSKLIIFCGVGFMAETAKILNPEAKVVIPSTQASCSLVDGFSSNGKNYDGLTAEDCIKLKEQFPGLPLVTYVNSTAAVKAETYACCTSSNAVQIIQALGNRVIFVPDSNMARNICAETSRALVLPQPDGRYEITEFAKKGNSLYEQSSFIADYEQARHYVGTHRVLVGKNGKCMVHEQFTPQQIAHIKKYNEGIKVLSHLECSSDVVEGSDYNGSTSGMIKYIAQSPAKKFFVITECNMAGTLNQQFPDKEFYTPCVVCPHMGQITIENTLEALRNEKPEVMLSKEVMDKARVALYRMKELTTGR